MFLNFKDIIIAESGNVVGWYLGRQSATLSFAAPVKKYINRVHEIVVGSARCSGSVTRKKPGRRPTQHPPPSRHPRPAPPPKRGRAARPHPRCGSARPPHPARRLQLVEEQQVQLGLVGPTFFSSEPAEGKQTLDPVICRCYENFVQQRTLKRSQDVRKQLLGIMDRHKLDVVSCGKSTTRWAGTTITITTITITTNTTTTTTITTTTTTITTTTTRGGQIGLFKIKSNPLRNELEEFVNCISNKQIPFVDVDNAIAVAKNLDLLSKSLV